MSTCKDCKYWSSVSRIVGVCDRIKIIYDGPSDKPEETTENEGAVLVTYDDDQGLGIMFRSGPDFGCTLYE